MKQFLAVLVGLVALGMAATYVAAPTTASASVKAHVSRVYPMNQVIARSEKASKAACYNMQAWWGGKLRCEGWDGTGCHRYGLSTYWANHFQCYQYYFMSFSGSMPQHIDCNRVAHYQSTNGYNLVLRKSGTSQWKCAKAPGPHHVQT